MKTYFINVVLEKESLITACAFLGHDGLAQDYLMQDK